MSEVRGSQDRFLRRLASHRDSVTPDKLDRFDRKLNEIEALTGRVNVAVSQLMHLTSKAAGTQIHAEAAEEKKKFNPDADESKLNAGQEEMLSRLLAHRSDCKEEDLHQFDDTLDLVKAYARRMNAAVAHLAYLSPPKESKPADAN